MSARLMNLGKPQKGGKPGKPCGNVEPRDRGSTDGLTWKSGLPKSKSADAADQIEVIHTSPGRS